MAGGQDTELPKPVPGPTEVAKPVEQSTQEQLNTLIEELNRQDESMGGKLLIRIPISAKDPREVLFFSVRGTNNPDPVISYGVHPDRGPIAVVERRQAHNMKLTDGILQHRAGHKEWQGILDEVVKENQIVQVNSHNLFEEWQESYKRSKSYAEGEMREEAVKRQFLPKALEVVRGVPAEAATASPEAQMPLPPQPAA